MIFEIREHLTFYRNAYLRGLAVLAVVTIAAVVALIRLEKRAETAAWTEQPATITKVTVIEKGPESKSGRNRLIIDISHRYSVDGQNFEGSRRMDVLLMAFFPYRERLRAGEEITIHTDPKDPATSVVTGPVPEP